MATNKKIKYLIIGNSAGGIGAAEAIREVDKVGGIAIISEESYLTYSRPLIAKYLIDRCPPEKILYRPEDFYERNNIRLILDQNIAQLELKTHSVELANGEILTWQKLLLATGGYPIIPPMENIGLDGVFTFTTLDHAKAIDDFLSQHSGREVKTVVIGGGLIGISVTDALVKRGINVTIVEMQERILSTMLDSEAATLEQAGLSKAGVQIITGSTVDKINSYLPGVATGVTLSDGQSIPCDMVIVAIGVQPRVELAADAGIKINRGILVDRQMTTSEPNIYACGDAAEAYDFIYGENRLSPIWPNAYLGGRTAGFNMAGVPTEYQGGTTMNAMKYFGVNIVSAGMINPPDDSYETITSGHDDIYKKVILKDGMITGIIFAGDIEKSGIVYNLMKDGVTVEAFKQSLVADDFGLVSLPEGIWRPKLAAPSSTSVSPATAIEQPEEVLAGE